MRAVHGSVESTSAPTGAPAAASINAAPSRSPVARSTPNAMTHQVPSAGSSGPSSAGASRVDRPVLHRRPVRHALGESGRPEDHPEVRAQRVLAHVVRADELAHRAARAVAPEDVVGPDRLGVVQAHRHPVRVLHEPGDAGAQRERHGVEPEDDLTEQLLEHVLRRLLTDLREAVTLRREAEHPGEARELAAHQRRAEHDVGGEVHATAGARSRSRSASPHRRRCSMVRTLTVLHRGRACDTVARGSTTRHSTPRRPSSTAAASPTGPPPATSTWVLRTAQ